MDSDNNEVVLCHFCNKTLPRDQFHPKINQGCRDCHTRRERERCETWRGAMKQLVRHSHTSTTHRNDPTRKDGGRGHEHDVTFEFIVELLLDKQKGLCAYSNVPLEPNGPRCVSLERVNVTKGYTTDNVCLICRCFQSTVCGKDTTEWTKEKVDYLFETNT